jgi:hypothetical protein
VSYLFCLETGGTNQPGMIWCGTIPGALFVSNDHGGSWSLSQALWDLPERQHWAGGGFDDAGVASICIDPRRSDHLTIGVSTGGVWISDDTCAFPPTSGSPRWPSAAAARWPKR